MKFILIIFSLIISACQPPDSKSSSPQASTDPIFGDWRYTIPGTSTSNSLKFIVAKIDPTQVSFLVAYGIGDLASMKIYFRRNDGTYKRIGNKFEINYSHETCNPVGSETLIINVGGANNGNLMISSPDNSINLIFSRITPIDNSQLTAALIEDKNCNIISKLQKRASRSIAKEKIKSFFDILSFK